jgi:hypothetical protein
MSRGCEIAWHNWYVNERQGWYEFNITKPDAASWDEYFELYMSVVEWIVTNIEMPFRHSRWIIQEQATFRFRYERDYLRFILRWG